MQHGRFHSQHDLWLTYFGSNFAYCALQQHSSRTDCGVEAYLTKHLSIAIIIMTTN